MTAQLREGIEKKPTVTLSNEVKCDEAYVIAGHKGQPEVVKSKGRPGRRRRLQGTSGRGTREKERPPVFGMRQRGGQVVINLLANVQRKALGLSCGVGCARIGVFPKRNSQSTWEFFEFVHNVRKRGKTLLPALIELLVT